MKSFFIVAFFSYLALLAFLYFNQRNMLYFPDTNRPDPAEFGVVEQVEIVKVKTQDGLNLQAWYIPASNPLKPTIILFHGNAGNRGHRAYKAKLYTAQGYGVLLTEYRGYGGNPGTPSEQGFYQDARAFIQWLKKEKELEDRNLVLYGESIGTGVAIQIATEFPVAGLILEAPYSSILDVAKETYFFVPVSILLKDKFLSAEKIGRITVPKIFLHGESDQVIPIKFSRKLFEMAPEPKTFISFPQGAHNDLYNYAAQLHVLDFLSKIETELNPPANKEETKTIN